MYWYMKALKQYVGFSGRARRREYWIFTAVNLAIAIVLGIIEGMLGGPGILGGLFNLAVLLPTIAVTVRRLHDIGRSGWWMLIVLIPIVGAIVLLVFVLLDSKPGENQYGPNPKGNGDPEYAPA
ncbi:DUF805 domain-containing protein [Marinobacter subterrani]|uniref:DUF805 domain-containing protein n=1 Tax=Marinobacter subterrani TaxID=1658765 RepID=UPI002353F82E|nr:DUF805 domain-containing protein [Marinobacter subterrani]